MLEFELIVLSLIITTNVIAIVIGARLQEFLQKIFRQSQKLLLYDGFRSSQSEPCHNKINNLRHTGDLNKDTGLVNQARALDEKTFLSFISL